MLLIFVFILKFELIHYIYLIVFTGYIEGGAVLRVTENVTGSKFDLSGNSAVLYLLTSSQQTLDPRTEAWLHWETTILQVR